MIIEVVISTQLSSVLQKLKKNISNKWLCTYIMVTKI